MIGEFRIVSLAVRVDSLGGSGCWLGVHIAATFAGIEGEVCGTTWKPSELDLFVSLRRAFDSIDLWVIFGCFLRAILSMCT